MPQAIAPAPAPTTMTTRADAAATANIPSTTTPGVVAPVRSTAAAPTVAPSSSSSSSPAANTSSITLVSGALAGLSVDCVLFPLDTIKTRMQSKGGIGKAGGFGKLFSGVASAAAGSAPTAALFFITYETCKTHLTPLFHRPTPSGMGGDGHGGVALNPLVHCLAASVGEVIACLVRVPTENVKQKVQAGLYRSSWECFRALLKAQQHTHQAVGHVTAATAAAGGGSPFLSAPPRPSPGGGGALRNFYRGFGSTILREIPFAFLQFPLYEWSKWRVQEWRHHHHLQLAGGGVARDRQPPLDGATCALLGSISGGFAAAATTPLDVVKTRMMLQAAHSTHGIAAGGGGGAPAAALGVLGIFKSVYREGGVSRLFSGVVPRVLWISLGGGVFFGAYETSRKWLAEIA